MTLRTVGILGGMGPAAGADFVRLFVQACADHLRASGAPVTDQGYPEHWLAQLPIPDRSAALLAPGSAQDPLAMMCQGLDKLQAAGAVAVAVACNTAHAWHERLQQAYPQLQLLHIARVVAEGLQQQGHQSCMLLATQGTYRIGLYDQALAACGITVHLPEEDERELLMRGIYQGVKADRMDQARADFAAVAQAMRTRHGDMPLIMGCTEIPLALPGAASVQGLPLIDPSWELARALARVAYGN
ncbi:MAG: amino acid racemase [Comamonas sp.]